MYFLGRIGFRMGRRPVALTPELILLVIVTGAQILLQIDKWVHRREAAESEQRALVAGKLPLQSQIDDIRSSSIHRMEMYEKLRLERASIVAQELAELHGSIKELHQRASDYGDEMQVKLSVFEERTIRLEERQEELFRIVNSRRR